MDLNQFIEQIEIKLSELPDVVFYCRRPRLEEVDSQSGAKRIKSIWNSNVQNWEGLELDGKPFECTSENKKKLLETYRKKNLTRPKMTVTKNPNLTISSGRNSNCLCLIKCDLCCILTITLTCII